MKNQRNFAPMFATAVASLTIISTALPTPADAAIYTDQASFDAQIAGLGLGTSWTEDFESYTAGPVANPFAIAGGQAEIERFEGASAVGLVGPSNQAYGRNVDGDTIADLAIRGPGNSGLGLRALSFNYASEGSVDVDFAHSAGIESITGALGTSNPAPIRFLGWIADTDEILAFSRLNQTFDVTLDNVRGFGAIPEPATLVVWSLLIAATGVFSWARRLGFGRSSGAHFANH